MLREIFDNLERHCGKHSHYFEVYDRHVQKYVGTKPLVVEVGICRGGSAEMWQKYFGDGATIVGIDADPEAFKEEYQTPGCIQLRGDQGSAEFWAEFCEKYPEIDVFIDDGGHHMTQQITTLIEVWESIKPGGIYICEDTHTSYWAEYGGGLRRPQSFMEYSKKIIDVLNSLHVRDADKTQDEKIFQEYFQDIASMHFYDSMVIIEKGPRPESKLVTSTPI